MPNKKTTSTEPECEHCGVVVKISTKHLIRALLKGLREQNLEIVSTAKPTTAHGTLYKAFAPLRSRLRRKGFKIS